MPTTTRRPHLDRRRRLQHFSRRPAFASEKTVPNFWPRFPLGLAGNPFVWRIPLPATSVIRPPFRPHLLSRRHLDQSRGSARPRGNPATRSRVHDSSASQALMDARAPCPEASLTQTFRPARRQSPLPSYTKLPGSNSLRIQRVLHRAMHLARDFARRLRHHRAFRQSRSVFPRITPPNASTARTIHPGALRFSRTAASRL